MRIKEQETRLTLHEHDDDDDDDDDDFKCCFIYHLSREDSHIASKLWLDDPGFKSRLKQRIFLVS